jgi:hypothetical protein
MTERTRRKATGDEPPPPLIDDGVQRKLNFLRDLAEGRAQLPPPPDFSGLAAAQKGSIVPTVAMIIDGVAHPATHTIDGVRVEDIIAGQNEHIADLERRLDAIHEKSSDAAIRALADFRSEGGKAKAAKYQKQRWCLHIVNVVAQKIRAAKPTPTKVKMVSDAIKSLDDRGINHPEYEQVQRFIERLQEEGTLPLSPRQHRLKK